MTQTIHRWPWCISCGGVLLYLAMLASALATADETRHASGGGGNRHNVEQRELSEMELAAGSMTPTSSISATSTPRILEFTSSEGSHSTSIRRTPTISSNTTTPTLASLAVSPTPEVTQNEKQSMTTMSTLASLTVSPTPEGTQNEKQSMTATLRSPSSCAWSTTTRAFARSHNPATNTIEPSPTSTGSIVGSPLASASRSSSPFSSTSVATSKAPSILPPTASTTTTFWASVSPYRATRTTSSTCQPSSRISETPTSGSLATPSVSSLLQAPMFAYRADFQLRLDKEGTSIYGSFSHDDLSMLIDGRLRESLDNAGSKLDIALQSAEDTAAILHMNVSLSVCAPDPRPELVRLTKELYSQILSANSPLRKKGITSYLQFAVFGIDYRSGPVFHLSPDLVKLRLTHHDTMSVTINATNSGCYALTISKIQPVGSSPKDCSNSKEPWPRPAESLPIVVDGGQRRELLFFIDSSCFKGFSGSMAVTELKVTAKEVEYSVSVLLEVIVDHEGDNKHKSFPDWIYDFTWKTYAISALSVVAAVTALALCCVRRMRRCCLRCLQRICCRTPANYRALQEETIEPTDEQPSGYSSDQGDTGNLEMTAIHGTSYDSSYSERAPNTHDELHVSLSSAGYMQPSEFERVWKQYPTIYTLSDALDRQMLEDTNSFISALRTHDIHCLASGRVDSKERIYCFAIAEPNVTFLIEVTLLHEDELVTIQVKASEPSSEIVQAFLPFFKGIVSRFLPSLA
eukprot:gb/GECG01014539.1/.p1 GENE.gb/GECG01014539.1/~~gb/GECG01014539.1/.p1  ORF type:complete len:746 (+),score=57.98 gb/GECG01014539.1/:1-2238(+)